MPIDSEELWLINADATDRAKIDKALDYIQTEMPFNGAPSIEQFAGKNIQIEINHNGRNEFAIIDGVATVHWDPDKALAIFDNDGNIVGVNSPASVLLHEINHALDEDIRVNTAEDNRTWDDDAERYAIQRTNNAMEEAGEAQRENHSGDPINSRDVTEHTTTPDGNTLVWVEKDSWGLDNFGDTFDMGDLASGCPDIGGSANHWPLLPEDDGTDRSIPEDDGTDRSIPDALAATSPDNMILVGTSGHHLLLDTFMYA